MDNILLSPFPLADSVQLLFDLAIEVQLAVALYCFLCPIYQNKITFCPNTVAMCCLRDQDEGNFLKSNGKREIDYLYKEVISEN